MGAKHQIDKLIAYGLQKKFPRPGWRQQGTFDTPDKEGYYNGVRSEFAHRKGDTLAVRYHGLKGASGSTQIVHNGVVVFDGTPEEAHSALRKHFGIRNPGAAGVDMFHRRRR